MSMDFNIYDPDTTTIIRKIFNVCNHNGARVCWGLSLDAYSDGGLPGRGGDCDAHTALARVEAWLSLWQNGGPDESVPDGYLQGRVHELYDALAGALEDHPDKNLKLSWA